MLLEAPIVHFNEVVRPSQLSSAQGSVDKRQLSKIEDDGVSDLVLLDYVQHFAQTVQVKPV